MRTPAILVAGACAVLLGLTACGESDEPTEESTTAEGASAVESTAAASETTAASEDAAAEDSGIDPRLEVLVGTWEADPQEVGPHGSKLTIAEDGSASYMSGGNLHGAYEGSIILGSANPHRFEGVEEETGSSKTIEFEFDSEADTLILDLYSGESEPVVHQRTA